MTKVGASQSGVTIVTQTDDPAIRVSQSGVTVVTEWPSPQILVSQSGVTVIGCVPPAAPSALVARGFESRIILSWADNSDTEIGFTVERSIDGVNFATLTTLNAGMTSYADLNVVPGITYTYRVTAYDALCGATSAAISATATGAPRRGLARVTIWDRFGCGLGEVQADIGPVSWILDGIGRASLTMATSDPKATADMLHIGNRVLLEFDNGLPLWGGVIDLPRIWSEGTITVTCYTIEHLLDYRVTEKNAAFYELPLGAIFTRLLAREEEQDPLGIVPGSIWMGGHPHWPRYHYKSLWYVLDYSLSRMERCDFLFTPYIANGYIKFRADLFQEAGADKSAGVALIEGRNTAAGLRMEEQGAVVNTHIAVSEGSTWGPERITVAARDSDSVATYGLRETGKVYAGVSMPATLEMHARSEVNTNSNPRRIFSLEMTNNTPGTFADYDLGDTVACILPSFGFGGFNGKVRILGREYNPGTGTCKLVVEEPHEIEPWIYTEDEQETEE